MELINRENILRYIGDLQQTETMTPDARKLLQAVWRCVAAAVDYSGEYVPVVKCRDCIWFAEEFPYNACRYHDIWTEEEAYCSDGRRKDGERD